ncbi:MAG: M56 family metallopeptidase [Pirellulaceae bacterium]|jgi:beta-lactamase regulating signal transducer with metallopeptidase domain|nr:M56 family metallopeptidase [Pirellulaceae bacterium]MDP7016349.1 M56 family metallopeptidase [Pirellulaceae bacterium]
MTGLLELLYPGDSLSLLAMTWIAQSTLLTIAAWGLARLLRRCGAAAEHAVWKWALIGHLALPAMLWATRGWDVGIRWSPRAAAVASSPSLESPSSESPVPSVVDERIADDSVAAAVETEGSPAAMEVSPPEVSPPPYTAARLLSPYAEWTDRPAEDRLTTVHALAVCGIGVWLAGSLWLSIVSAHQYLRLRRWRARSQAWGRGEAVIAAARRRCRYDRQVEVRTSLDAPAPLVCGLWRPIMLAPASLVEQLDESSLEDVLVHELAHLRRGDLWWGGLERAALIAAWWSPPVRLALHGLSESRERVCDIYVIRDGDRRRYAMALVAAAEAIKRGAVRSEMAAGLFGNSRRFERRVAALLDSRSKNVTQVRLTFTAILATVCAVFLVAAASLRLRAQSDDDAIAAPPPVSSIADDDGGDVASKALQAASQAGSKPPDPPKTESDDNPEPEKEPVKRWWSNKSEGAVWAEIGLQCEELDKAAKLIIERSRYRGGLRVVAVRPAGPAGKAGIRPDDLLVGLQRWEIRSDDDLKFILRHRDQGSVKFYVLRAGSTLYGHIELGPPANANSVPAELKVVRTGKLDVTRAAILVRQISDLMDEKLEVTVDQRTNTLILRGRAETVRAVQNVLKQVEEMSRASRPAKGAADRENPKPENAGVDKKTEHPLVSTARRAYETSLIRYRQGAEGASIAELCKWSSRWMEAEMAADSTDQRTPVQSHLKRLGDLGSIVDALFEAGRATTDQKLDVEFHIEKAKFRLKSKE